MIRKMVMRIVFGVVVVLILALVVVWLMIDSIAKAGIEHGGTYALGVTTRVDEVDVNLMGGEVQIEGLRIDNPEGYEAKKLMKSGEFDLGVKGPSLFTDTVVVNKFELNELDVYIEENEKTNNVSEILDNVKERMKKDEDKEPSGKKLKIDTIVVRDITAHVKLRHKAEPIEVKVKEIRLENVSSEDGLPMSELIRQLFPAIIIGVVNEGGSVIGSALSNQLTKDMTGFVGELGGDAAKMVGQLGGVGEKVSKDASKMIEDLGKSVDDVKKGVDDALKGIKGILD